MLTVGTPGREIEGLPDDARVDMSVDVAMGTGIRPVACEFPAKAAIGLAGPGLLVIEGCAEVDDGSVVPWDRS
ncbi:MAG: hypothetical protein Q4A01_11255 [Coriobacteriales bacterium]|nr:hypothetical protein [Coriobacteriales bacterium]